jgi:uncharacterized membrane protein YjjP (DUF1212 family)
MDGAIGRMATALGCHLTIRPTWNALTLEVRDDFATQAETLPSRPVGVDMNRVSATMDVIDDVCASRLSVKDAQRALEAIGRAPPVGILRFALMAAAGAVALAVIFGMKHPLSFILIALSAATGALLRRWLARQTKNLFAQPFSAALLAGIIGALTFRLQLSSSAHLIAVCPCMILVPGPHILNGALDLVRLRLPLGLARITFAGLLIAAICAGLVLGLALGGADLPATGPSLPVPLIEDVLAAGVAVAAYGSFFNMPWRTIPVPVAVGMLAHASRWWLLSAGANGALGALAACLVVGAIMTPVSALMRLPFAGLAFASVVSLIPGVYLFRVAGGLYDVLSLAPAARPAVYAQILSDGTNALLILAAMTAGLVAPKICLEALPIARKWK